VTGSHPAHREAPSTGDNAVASPATTSRIPEAAPSAPSAPSSPQDNIGRSGERLTRDEAFDLVRRTVSAMVQGDTAVPASALRKRAFELLGRDSESLSDRFFNRVLRDAHDGDVIDLRRRGDDFEVALPAKVAPVAAQLNRAAAAHGTPAPTPAAATPMMRGMGPRGIPAKGRGGRGAPPADLLMVGVVETPSAAAPVAVVATEAPAAAPAAKGRAPRAKAKSKTAAAEGKAAPKKKARAPRAKKSAGAAE